MNITGLTSKYDIYYKGKKLNNILEMDYEVVAATISEHYVEIDIIYIDDDDHLKNITTLSDSIEFKKKEGNENEYKN